jgi:hypothetical protein
LTTSPTTPRDPTRPGGGRPERFSRSDLARGPSQPLHEGRWANAVVLIFEAAGDRWVVKDFRPRSFLVRNTIGRFLIWRESRGLMRLAGISGTPEAAFRIDPYALAYRFVPGQGLRRYRGPLNPGFFPKLERTVIEMHRRARIVHLDMRNADNILITDSDDPMLLDLQSHVGTRWLPGPLRRFGERIDLAAIYKHWAKRSPETLGAERASALASINRLRPIWVLRGYIGSEKPPRKKPRPHS